MRQPLLGYIWCSQVYMKVIWKRGCLRFEIWFMSSGLRKQKLSLDISSSDFKSKDVSFESIRWLPVNFFIQKLHHHHKVLEKNSESYEAFVTFKIKCVKTIDNLPRECCCWIFKLRDCKLNNSIKQSGNNAIQAFACQLHMYMYKKSPFDGIRLQQTVYFSV